MIETKRSAILMAGLALLVAGCGRGKSEPPAPSRPARTPIERREQAACWYNLRSIEASKRSMAEEFRLKKGAKIDWYQLNDFLESADVCRCPAGGTYTLGPIGTPPSCSIHGRAPAQRR